MDRGADGVGQHVLDPGLLVLLGLVVVRGPVLYAVIAKARKPRQPAPRPAPAGRLPEDGPAPAVDRLGPVVLVPGLPVHPEHLCKPVQAGDVPADRQHCAVPADRAACPHLGHGPVHGRRREARPFGDRRRRRRGPYVRQHGLVRAAQQGAYVALFGDPPEQHRPRAACNADRSSRVVDVSGGGQLPHRPAQAAAPPGTEDDSQAGGCLWAIQERPDDGDLVRVHTGYRFLLIIYIYPADFDTR